MAPFSDRTVRAFLVLASILQLSRAAARFRDQRPSAATVEGFDDCGFPGLETSNVFAPVAHRACAETRCYPQQPELHPSGGIGPSLDRPLERAAMGKFRASAGVPAAPPTRTA
jgi:hypothetical protein